MWSKRAGDEGGCPPRLRVVDTQAAAAAAGDDLPDELQAIAQQLSEDAARLSARYPAAVERAPVVRGGGRLWRPSLAAALAIVAALVGLSAILPGGRDAAPPRTIQATQIMPAAMPAAAPAVGVFDAVSFDRLSTSEQEAVLDLLEQQADAHVGLSF